MDHPVKILFVEDLPSDVELVERELRINNIVFEAVRVETRETFTEQLKLFQPDIIISDYSLPRFNGMEALFITLNQTPHVPFIVLTGSTNEETAVECMKAGATDYVIKEHLSRIVPAIQVALNRTYMIAEKTAMELELNKSRERLNFALQGIRAGVWDWDLVTNKKYYSTEWALMLGYETEELLKIPEFWQTTVYPDDLPELNNRIESYLSGSLPLYENVHRKITKNGELIWVLDRGQIVERDSNGKPTHLTGIIIDITNQKLAEASHVRLMAAVEQTSETFVVTDSIGNIEYVNPAFELTSGYTHDEVVGKNPRILRSGKHDNEFYRKMWDTLSRGEVWRGHIINKHKSGSLFEEEATISPVRDASGKTVNYVAVKRNITRERQLEDQLLQAQKMEAIGRLAGGVAHDFNNLLTIITGNAELLELHAGSDPLLTDGLQLIRQTVERGTALTRQLLAFSRRQPQQPKIVNLNEILQGMQKMLTRLIGEDIELKFMFDHGLPNMKADPGQIEQVVMNLIVNARDAMPGGGKIILKTEVTTFHPGDFIEPSPIQIGRYCTLAVTDTGSGMTKEVREHALEPFYTTKPVGKGTGLGLSMVHGVVTQSGGMVQIQSEEGIGTSIMIYLPVVDEAIEKATFAVSTNLQGKNEHILVIEDETAILDMLMAILTQNGYRVTYAKNGKEALMLLLRAKEGFNLLLTDVIMPQVSGPQLVEWVKARHPETKVIYMSGYTTEAVVQQIQDQGLPFLQKPFKTNDLLQAVRATLDSK